MTSSAALRPDQQRVAALIAEGSRVLDIGCGDGSLLHWLVQHRQVQAHGMELSQQGVNECVRKGLAVVQGDADTDLRDYPDKSFDVAILSQTLQAMHRPKDVLAELARIGRRVIVSFPNFGHWQVRWKLLSTGRMPVSTAIPYQWFDTPNIHLCTWNDMHALCADLGLTVLESIAVRAGGRQPVRLWPNMLAEQGMLVVES